MTIAGKTCVFQKQNDPSKLRFVCKRLICFATNIYTNRPVSRYLLLFSGYFVSFETCKLKGEWYLLQTKNISPKAGCATLARHGSSLSADNVALISLLKNRAYGFKGVTGLQIREDRGRCLFIYSRLARWISFDIDCISPPIQLSRFDCIHTCKHTKDLLHLTCFSPQGAIGRKADRLYSWGWWSRVPGRDVCWDRGNYDDIHNQKRHRQCELWIRRY